MAGAWLSVGSLGAAGAGAQAFGGCPECPGRHKSKKSALDAGRGELVGFPLSFPGQAERLGERDGVANLSEDLSVEPVRGSGANYRLPSDLRPCWSSAQEVQIVCVLVNQK